MCRDHDSVVCPCPRRVLDVPVEYGNVLEVGYTLPGYLAAGVSGEVTLTFTPKANEDIETQVRGTGASVAVAMPSPHSQRRQVLLTSTRESRPLGSNPSRGAFPVPVERSVWKRAVRLRDPPHVVSAAHR